MARIKRSYIIYLLAVVAAGYLAFYFAGKSVDVEPDSGAEMAEEAEQRPDTARETLEKEGVDLPPPSFDDNATAPFQQPSGEEAEQDEPAPPPQPDREPTAPSGGKNAAGEETPRPPSLQGEMVEDAVVPLSFVDELAEYCVSRYLPPRTRANPSDEPLNRLTFKALNMRFGLDRDAFGRGPDSALAMRKEILGYAFQPGFIEYLADLYSAEFADTLVRQAEEAMREYRLGEGEFERRALSDADIRGMLRAFAAQADGAGRIFDALAKAPKLMGLVADHQQAADMVLEAHRKFDSRENLSPEQVDERGAAIKRAIARREQMRERLTARVRKAAGDVVLSDAEVLYLTTWAYRRHQDFPDWRASLEEAGAALRDLSRLLLEEAGEL
ncbi:hypothetical protein [Desulfohalovibrio reitneri]|uniref:hypothetical protein n=1 Tax=Desulfohalovibrio reitneri TaxID=1307759 RepID=UPI0004A6C82B|nr:hypothetical protein [Desulfohalovibrio reitneri]